MSHRFRTLLSAALLFLLVATPSVAIAQGNPEPHSFKFNTGQGLQPIFEGWAKNPDGTYSMYFGYFNRNFVEALTIAVGPENRIEPGMPDRGQPTFFNTRIRRNQFNVVVPKDWGKKELVWSVTVRGNTEKAVGWLQPEWEIDPIYGGKTRTPESLKNKAPKWPTVALPTSLSLAATVQDDGLPVPRKGPPRQAAVGQETPPALKPLPDQAEVPVNVPSIGAGARGGRGQGPQGLAVNWFVWRGPAAVTFEPATIPVKDGKAVVMATFTKPGTYVLRARANDGELNDEKDVTVTVTGSAQR